MSAPCCSCARMTVRRSWPPARKARPPASAGAIVMSSRRSMSPRSWGSTRRPASGCGRRHEGGRRMATLTLERVGKIYRQRRRQPVHAVIDVSMAIEDGEIVGLLGSSGCGKTSTLRMIAGFEEVSQGVIRLGSRVLNTLRPAERNVAMAFEGYALYPPLTLRDNIGFSLLRDRGARATAEGRIRQ